LARSLKSSRIRTCDYTTCWNCGGKVDEASECSSKKAGGNASYNQGEKPRSGLLPGMARLMLQRSLKSLKSTTLMPSAEKKTRQRGF